MATVFLVAAVAGAGILLVQMALGLFGLDHDADADAHDLHAADAHEGLHFLSIRAIAAALAFGGLAGWAVVAGGRSPILALIGAVVAGGFAMVAVAWAMRALLRLRADGTVDTDRAVGASGTVYIPISGLPDDPGKVHITLQGRTVELAAVSHTALATGQPVTVVGLVGPGCVEVVATPTDEELFDVQH